jgi:hypothetical protein
MRAIDGIKLNQASVIDTFKGAFKLDITLFYWIY